MRAISHPPTEAPKTQDCRLRIRHTICKVTAELENALLRISSKFTCLLAYTGRDNSWPVLKPWASSEALKTWARILQSCFVWESLCSLRRTGLLDPLTALFN
jgi:hypothetical protein